MTKLNKTNKNNMIKKLNKSKIKFKRTWLKKKIPLEKKWLRWPINLVKISRHKLKN